MDIVENTTTQIPKRVRLNPPRKWYVAEEKSLIEFLLENRDFENPTAQVYYKRFSEEKNVSADWKQVRSKVRHMRFSYNKAKAWEGSTGAGSMEGDTVKNTLLKICGFYDEMDDIFGSRIIESAIIEDSLEQGESFLNSTEIFIDDTIPSSDSLICENKPLTSRKGIYSRTAVSDIIKMQSDMMVLKKEKLDHQKKISEREINIREKELNIKEKELDIKIKELETQKELKIMELQMKERLAAEELRLKYKN